MNALLNGLAYAQLVAARNQAMNPYGGTVNYGAAAAQQANQAAGVAQSVAPYGNDPGSAFDASAAIDPYGPRTYSRYGYSPNYQSIHDNAPEANAGNYTDAYFFASLPNMTEDRFVGRLRAVAQDNGLNFRPSQEQFWRGWFRRTSGGQQ